MNNYLTLVKISNLRKSSVFLRWKPIKGLLVEALKNGYKNTVEDFAGRIAFTCPFNFTPFPEALIIDVTILNGDFKEDIAEIIFSAINAKKGSEIACAHPKIFPVLWGRKKLVIVRWPSGRITSASHPPEKKVS